MGTMLVVTAWGSDTATLIRALRDARDSVRLVDSLMSVYSSRSELSRVNSAAGVGAVHVSPQLMRVLEKARAYWKLSGGAFDPTIGPLVSAWGFHGDKGRVPPKAELDSLRALVNFGEVEIDTASRTIRLPRLGMRLDLGGIAKGYALDLAGAAMRRPDITAGMVDLGGNVLVFGPPPNGDQWRIGIRHPRGDSAMLGYLSLDSGAVATSGDYERFYMIDDARYAHIIDPGTGRPARGVIAVSVFGPRGEWSDGLSAALYLTGPVRGMAIADSLAEVGAIYVVERNNRADLLLSKRAKERFRRAP